MSNTQVFFRNNPQPTYPEEDNLMFKKLALLLVFLSLALSACGHSAPATAIPTQTATAVPTATVVRAHDAPVSTPNPTDRWNQLSHIRNGEVGWSVRVSNGCAADNSCSGPINIMALNTVVVAENGVYKGTYHPGDIITVNWNHTQLFGIDETAVPFVTGWNEGAYLFAGEYVLVTGFSSEQVEFINLKDGRPYLINQQVDILNFTQGNNLPFFGMLSCEMSKSGITSCSVK